MPRIIYQLLSFTIGFHLGLVKHRKQNSMELLKLIVAIATLQIPGRTNIYYPKKKRAKIPSLMPPDSHVSDQVAQCIDYRLRH